MATCEVDPDNEQQDERHGNNASDGSVQGKEDEQQRQGEHDVAEAGERARRKEQGVAEAEGRELCTQNDAVKAGGRELRVPLGRTIPQRTSIKPPAPPTRRGLDTPPTTATMTLKPSSSARRELVTPPASEAMDERGGEASRSPEE